MRGARLRVLSKTGRSTIVQRPIQQLFPLEIPQCTSEEDTIVTTPNDTPNDTPDHETLTSPNSRPTRAAAFDARSKIVAALTD